MSKKSYDALQIKARVKRLLLDALNTKEFEEMITEQVGEEFDDGEHTSPSGIKSIIHAESAAHDYYSLARAAAVRAIQKD